MGELINVIGLGYIGLPTAIMMSANGLNVVGTDLDQAKVEQLRNGILFFHEEGIEEIFSTARENGIKFASEYQEADIYILAVPTPFDKKSKKVDSRFLVNAAREAARVCRSGAIIVIESTIPPGTISNWINPIIEDAKHRLGKTIYIAHAPERIIPGKMINELVYNNRTIGADRPEVAQKIRGIYGAFCQGEIITTDIKTAELSKVAENAFRDVNIAYANELVKICREAGIDVRKLINIANRHPRVNILSPGPGVGGHCISVDPWFLVGDYPGLVNIILSARNINDSMPQYVLERIAEIMEEHEISDSSRVGLYGLTYKENVNDIRESPTLQMVDFMKRHLIKGIKVYDPYIHDNLVDNQFHSFERFIKSIDLLVVMVGHDEIIEKQDELRNLVVFDTRGVLSIEGVIGL